MIRVTATVVDFRIAENIPIGVVIAAGSTIFVGITGVTKSATKSGVKSDMKIGMITAVVTTADADNRKEVLKSSVQARSARTRNGLGSLNWG